MKKALLFSVLFTIVGLISCDEEFDCPEISKEMSNVTFNITASVPLTKAANITRYIVEIYNSSDPTTVVERVEHDSGTIIVSLDTNVNYTCLFWADGVAPDDNESGTYNASDLKNVTLNTGKEMDEAFFTRFDIIDATPTYNVSLKRATAQGAQLWINPIY